MTGLGTTSVLAFSDPLNVAIIGLGVGEQHAHAYVRDDRCRVSWLFDLDMPKAEEVLGRVGDGRLAESYEAVLDDQATTVVSLATYDDRHYGEVIQAFGAGKHVFVEKPLCRTMDELRHVVQAWCDGGRPHLASNLVLREAPLYTWLKAEIAAGTLGDIYAIDGEYLYGRLPKITEGWRKDVRDYSVMEGGGIHIIDLMLDMVGERPNTVHTIGNRVATQDTDFQYDDFQAATFTFPSGVIGRIGANFACVHRHHHVLRVFGTRATFIYDDAGPRLHTTRDENVEATPVRQNPLPAGKGVLIPAFIDAIVSGQDSGPAAQREFDLVSVCAHSDISHATGQTVTIEYVEQDET